MAARPGRMGEVPTGNNGGGASPSGRPHSRGEEKPRSARKSVRTRNNTRIQKFTNTARTYKSISVNCSQSEWRLLKQKFKLIPDVARDPKTGMVVGFREAYTYIQPRDPSVPTVQVDGILFDIRKGDLISIADLGIPQEYLMTAVCCSEEEFERVVDSWVEALFQQSWSVKLAFCMYVKLKVELFETTLPPWAPVMHCYAGPKGIKESFQTVPDYVPEDMFLDLNKTAHCWVAKTMVERGFVQTTHHEVGPDHCFLPGETVYFRNNRVRFERPVWVVSKDEEAAFQRKLEESRRDDRKLDENFLVKKSLKRGDRFVLVPAYHRGDSNREIEEEELSASVLERSEEFGDGAISRKTAEFFSLNDRFKVTMRTADGRYVFVDNTERAGGSPKNGRLAGLLKAYRDRKEFATKFAWIGNEDGTVSLQTEEGKYVAVESQLGLLRAVATEKAYAGRFIVEPVGAQPQRPKSGMCRLRSSVDSRYVDLGPAGDLRQVSTGACMEFELQWYIYAKVSHCDCCCLIIENQNAAIVGAPLKEESSGVPWPNDDICFRDRPQLVRYYMDLRGRLGFNAVGLLHGQTVQRDITNYWVECPLNRQSVMTPTSRLLFLDHWRDQHEQKAFRKVVEAIQQGDFLKEVAGVFNPVQHALPAPADANEEEEAIEFDNEQPWPLAGSQGDDDLAVQL